MSKTAKKSPKEIKKIVLSILETSDISFMFSHKKKFVIPTSLVDLLTVNVFSGNIAEIRPNKGYEIAQVRYGSILVGHKEQYYVHNFILTPEQINLDITGKNELSNIRFQVYYKPK